MQPSQQGSSNILVTMAPFILIFGVFWLFLIRPQQRKAKLHRQTLTNLRKGDEVITSSGILGVVNKINAEKRLVWLEIADKTTVRMNLDHITQVINTNAGAKTKRAEPKPKKVSTPAKITEEASALKKTTEEAVAEVAVAEVTEKDSAQTASQPKKNKPRSKFKSGFKSSSKSKPKT